MRSLLEVVLGNPASVCANDLYRDDLDVEFGNLNLFDQMERINSVSGGEAPPPPPKNSANVKGKLTIPNARCRCIPSCV
jgi:hypothetical protein